MDPPMASGAWNYDVTPDGQRFLINTAATAAPEHLGIAIVNWSALLREQ
jgi:hypothetical protein